MVARSDTISGSVQCDLGPRSECRVGFDDYARHDVSRETYMQAASAMYELLAMSRMR